MFFKISTITFIIALGLHLSQCQPDYDDGCGCPCDRDDDDDPCWNNCDDDDGPGCGGLLANLGLGGTLGNVGGTLDNTLGGLGRKKRDINDVSLGDVAAIADIISRKKRESQRKPGGSEPNM